MKTRLVRSTIFLFGFALTLSGCGAGDSSSTGDDEFAGTYAVTSYSTTDGAGCSGATGDATANQDFFRLSEKAFEGTEPYLQFTWCSTVESCDSDVVFAGWFFDTKNGSKWEGDAFIELKQVEDSCELRIDTNTASLSGSTISLVKDSFIGTVDSLQDKPCDEQSQTEEIRAAYVDTYRGSSAMQCKTRDSLTGTKEG